MPCDIPRLGVIVILRDTLMTLWARSFFLSYLVEWKIIGNFAIGGN